MRLALIILMISVLLAVGCTSDTIDEQPIQDIQNNQQPKEEITMKTKITIETNKGTIKAELEDELAPITTKNFIKLAKSGFYDGLSWHRYVAGFVIQGGDPDGDGTGGSDETIPLETNPKLKHGKGVLSMARSQDPNSASSQFFITLAPAPHLDGGYAAFGKVTDGMDVVLQLREGDVMNKVIVEE